ncbi:hypothetical protein [Actinomadura gamaensis]|uniref:Uncharacterized protein n=1 Tax=Actinomadura gamaensis TaxID=1763541 RepID=A0ABV9U1I3_9ACTN
MTTISPTVKGRRARRLAAGLALTGGSALALLGVAGTAHADANSVTNTWLAPGQEACAAAHATTYLEASQQSASPGLKFKLIAQSGLVINTSPGPYTYWKTSTGTGSANWQGPGDYTACAKNNGTSPVYLYYVIITTS